MVFNSGKKQKYFKISIYQMSFLEKVFYSGKWQKYFKISIYQMSFFGEGILF